MRPARAAVERLRQPPRRHERPKHWIGVVLDSRLLPDRRTYAAAILGTVPFLVGLVLAAYGDFVGLYLTSYPVYLSAVLTGWVFAFGGYSDRALWRLPRRIRPAFREQRKTYRRDSRRLHRRLYSNWINLVPAVLLSALFIVVIAVWEGFWGVWFHPDFSSAPSFPIKIAILAINGTILVFLGVAMIWGYLNYVTYAYRVSTYRTISSINAARVYLRSITSFGMNTGLGWSVAVTLFVSSLARDLNTTALTFLVLFGTMGFVLIVLPQVLVHRSLQREQNRHLQIAARRLRRFVPRYTTQYVKAMTTEDAARRNLYRFEDFIERSNATSTWIYSPRDALVLSGQVLLPAAAIVVTLWTQS